MLPNTTERPVTLLRTAEATGNISIMLFNFGICPKGAMILYHPKPAMPSVTLQENYDLTADQTSLASVEACSIASPEPFPPQGFLCIPALTTLASRSTLQRETAARVLASIITAAIEKNIPNDLFYWMCFFKRRRKDQ